MVKQAPYEDDQDPSTVASMPDMEEGRANTNTAIRRNVRFEADVDPLESNNSSNGDDDGDDDDNYDDEKNSLIAPKKSPSKGSPQNNKKKGTKKPSLTSILKDLDDKQAAKVKARQAQADSDYEDSNNGGSCCCNCSFFGFVVLMVMGLLGSIGLGLLWWKQSMVASSEAGLLVPTRAGAGMTGTKATKINAASTHTTTPSSTTSHHTIHWDADAAATNNWNWNPLDHPPINPNLWTPPVPVPGSESDTQNVNNMGYLQQPNIVNDTLVFVSEGDLYVSRLPAGQEYHSMTANNIAPTATNIPAMKLTVTVGNVLSPKIHPVHSNLIAYTASYAGTRELYLYNLHAVEQQPPVMRLTYSADHGFGIHSIAGWHGDSIIFAAESNAVSLPDIRLYKLTLNGIGSSGSSSSRMSPTVLETTPVPLSQAVDGVYYDQQQPQQSLDVDSSNSNNTSNTKTASSCLYFTRVSQASRTIRYVGGTAENLWAYCDGHELAVPLTSDYNGTSKDATVWDPTAVTVSGSQLQQPYLLYLSDKSPVLENEEWKATTMNLWAQPLPTERDLYSPSFAAQNNHAHAGAVQLTHVSCQNNGRSVREYALDVVTGNVVLRIGADLHFLSAADIELRLLQALSKQQLQASGDFDANAAAAFEANAASKMAQTPRLPITVYSDFHEHQERLIEISMTRDLSAADVYDTAFGSTVMLMTIRGQLWVAPIIDDVEATKPYQGAGQNMPGRRYRVVPGAMTGGSVRVLTAKNVPLLLDEGKSARRLAVMLATDPLSPTAEQAFYLLETQTDSLSSFADLQHLPEPFVGGHVNGGSTREGGLGSVEARSVAVSPCGRRMAWTDTDGRICVMTLPLYNNSTGPAIPGNYTVLPEENELGEPLGTEADLMWSPGGRYLSVNHNALNQFRIISIVDCGNPNGEEADEIVDIAIGRIAQATPSRFNSNDMFWGKSPFDIDQYEQNMAMSKILDEPEPEDVATTLLFLTDRDIMTDVSSPWGSRAPSPHFKGESTVYALPLMPQPIDGEQEDASRGRFSGGGAAEIFVDDILAFDRKMDKADSKDDDDDDDDKDSRRRLTKIFHSLTAAVGKRRRTRKADTVARRLVESDTPSASPRRLDESATPSASPTAEKKKKSPFPQDANIDFGPEDLTFARRAYRIVGIPKGKYLTFASQTLDDASLALLEQDDGDLLLKIFLADDFPSDGLDSNTLEPKGLKLADFGLSTSREYLYLVFSPDGVTRVVPNTAKGMMQLIGDDKITQQIVDTEDLGVSVWPALEYKQMYNDAWRMLRDYFYDVNMTGIDWPAMHERYLLLVQRCAKREELDDVLSQMASELSALHVFVYGGETNSPLDTLPEELHKPSSLGATLKRWPEWKGYVVTEIHLRDPDFNLMDGEASYCPLSDQALRPSGQLGLEVGDVIVGVNGESVMSVIDIHMLLRGTAGRSVRLEVIRFASGNFNVTALEKAATTEPLLVVPISQGAAMTLRYNAWEWKTRQNAKALAAQAGFSVGYIHMQSMGSEDMDAFARGYYPDYDKQTLILDVRHNRGGNIDSWILGILQRKAFTFWYGRTGNKRKGDLDWDEQFAFRGHIVILIDEMTSSDGEGVSRGMSELGLGRLIGKRTWGGGIWLSQDNRLVDGGIASAPEIGTYNEKFSWGMGIEQQGVVPDVEVDNNPRTAFDGKDTQLERAIAELRQWLNEEPIVTPNPPDQKRDMSLHDEKCPV